MKRGLLLLALCLATVAARPAAAQSPETGGTPILRKGFTLALSIGVGGAALFPSVGGSEVQPAIGGVNVSLGGFLKPDLALLGRVALVNYGPLKDSNIEAAVVGVVGPALEWWLTDHLNLFGGAGIGFSGIKPKNIDGTGKAGVGLMLGGHWFPYAIQHHGLGVYVEMQPVFLGQGGGQAFTFQGGFAWQYY